MANIHNNNNIQNRCTGRVSSVAAVSYALEAYLSTLPQNRWPWVGWFVYLSLINDQQRPQKHPYHHYHHHHQHQHRWWWWWYWFGIIGIFVEGNTTNDVHNLMGIFILIIIHYTRIRITQCWLIDLIQFGKWDRHRENRSDRLIIFISFYRFSFQFGIIMSISCRCQSFWLFWSLFFG